MKLSEEIRNTRIDNYDSIELADRIAELEAALSAARDAALYEGVRAKELEIENQRLRAMLEQSKQEEMK